MSELFALVMAGGRGTRFWPLSRRSMPKQCVDLVEGGSLLQQTIARIQPLIPLERIIVATGPDMVDVVRDQLPGLPAENLLVEPSGRNTAPCVGLGAVEIQRRGGGESVMAVLPADQQIDDAHHLRDVLVAAADAANVTNALITLGIEPTRPDTGFGYLEVGSVMGTWGGLEFRMVERFTEKPDLNTASTFMASGRHLWNAGMFVFTVDAIRDAFRAHLPASAIALQKLQRSPDRLDELWPTMEATSLDYGIMERSRHILTVSCDLGWTDMGSWDRVSDSLPEIEGGRGIGEHIASIDSSGCVVHAPGKTVTLLGVDDLVVVDTPDALLVARRDRAQDVRQILALLEARGLDHLT